MTTENPEQEEPLVEYQGVCLTITRARARRRSLVEAQKIPTYEPIADRREPTGYVLQEISVFGRFDVLDSRREPTLHKVITDDTVSPNFPATIELTIHNDGPSQGAISGRVHISGNGLIAHVRGFSANDFGFLLDTLDSGNGFIDVDLYVDFRVTEKTKSAWLGTPSDSSDDESDEEVYLDILAMDVKAADGALGKISASAFARELNMAKSHLRESVFDDTVPIAVRTAISEYLRNHRPAPDTSFDDLRDHIVLQLHRTCVTEGLSTEVFVERYGQTFDILLDLHECLQSSHLARYNDPTYKQTIDDPFYPGLFWEHQSFFVEDPRLHSEEAFPGQHDLWFASRYAISTKHLPQATQTYLDTSWLKNRELDYVLTDAVVYAQIQENPYWEDDVPDRAAIRQHNGIITFGLYALYSVVLALIYIALPNIFLGAVIVVSCIEVLRSLRKYLGIDQTVYPNSKTMELRHELWRAYDHLTRDRYNPRVTRGMCDQLLENGFPLPQVLFTLLDRQIEGDYPATPDT